VNEASRLAAGARRGTNTHMLDLHASQRLMRFFER
jgi:hypothetical protein